MVQSGYVSAQHRYRKNPLAGFGQGVAGPVEEVLQVLAFAAVLVVEAHDGYPFAEHRETAQVHAFQLRTQFGPGAFQFFLGEVAHELHEALEAGLVGVKGNIIFVNSFEQGDMHAAVAQLAVHVPFITEVFGIERVLLVVQA